MALLDGTDGSGNYLSPPAVGGAVASPGGHYLGSASASGVQIYDCVAKDGGAEWKLYGPDATLSFAEGSGSHVRGSDLPEWWGPDGSRVAAKRVDGMEVGSGIIPWLLLEAQDWSGDGGLSRVQYIQRVDTNGGWIDPHAAVDQIGSRESVPYSATYHFWGVLPA